LTFYPLSGWLSAHYESYREIFTSTFPGGEAVADFADEHGWETFGYGTVSKKAVEAWQYVTGEKVPEPTTTRPRIERSAGDVRNMVERSVGEVRNRVGNLTKSAGGEMKKAAGQLEAKADKAGAVVKEKAEHAKDRVMGSSSSTKKTTDSAAASAMSLRDRVAEATEEAVDKTKALTSEVQAKVPEATSSIPFNFSDGVEGMVREAEKALGLSESKVEAGADRFVEAVTPSDSTPDRGPRVDFDATRTRGLHPETVSKPRKASTAGEELYAGPPLPLGHEPPPGYYLAPPPVSRKTSAEETAEKVRQTLPLLVPKVREFAAEEPIISELASTIDSLTASLSSPTSSPSADASGILSKAQEDLTSLSKRLDYVKRTEKEKLERTVEEKTKEFEAVLRRKEEERERGEQGLKEGWEKERQKMVDEWRGALETELESQRGGIEQR